MKTLHEVLSEHNRLGISGYFEDGGDFGALFDERVQMRRAEDKMRAAAENALSRWRPNKVANTPLSVVNPSAAPQGCLIAAFLMAEYKVTRCEDGTVKVGIRKSDLNHKS